MRTILYGVLLLGIYGVAAGMQSDMQRYKEEQKALRRAEKTIIVITELVKSEHDKEMIQRSCRCNNLWSTEVRLNIEPRDLVGATHVNIIAWRDTYGLVVDTQSEMPATVAIYKEGPAVTFESIKYKRGPAEVLFAAGALSVLGVIAHYNLPIVFQRLTSFLRIP